MSVHDVTHLFQIPLEWPRERLQVGRIEGIAVHHCATLWTRPDATVEEEINHLRAIDRYHREVRGFLGFAYHLAAFPTGRIYQVTSLKQMGAHVYQKNDRLYGIVVIGNFIATVPGEKQLDATAEGINHLDDFLGRIVEVGPHRKWGNSTCPGDTWEQWVPGLRIKEDTMTPEQEALLNSVAENLTRMDLQLQELLTNHNNPQGHPVVPTVKENLDRLSTAVAALQAVGGAVPAHRHTGTVEVK